MLKPQIKDISFISAQTHGIKVAGMLRSAQWCATLPLARGMLRLSSRMAAVLGSIQRQTGKLTRCLSSPASGKTLALSLVVARQVVYIVSCVWLDPEHGECNALGHLWSCLAAFSLDCFWWVLHPSIVQMHPPIGVSEAAAPPIRVMACKADLYSIVITKQFYTCKYTAIVTLVEDRGWMRD